MNTCSSPSARRLASDKEFKKTFVVCINGDKFFVLSWNDSLGMENSSQGLSFSLIGNRQKLKIFDAGVKGLWIEAFLKTNNFDKIGFSGNVQRHKYFNWNNIKTSFHLRWLPRFDSYLTNKKAGWGDIIFFSQKFGNKAKPSCIIISSTKFIGWSFKSGLSI